MGQRHKRLLKVEKQNKKKLSAALALLFLRVKSPNTLLFQVPFIVTAIRREIASLHGPARELANRDTATITDAVSTESTTNDLLIASAAMGLVSTVVARTQVAISEGEGFRDALQTALDASEARAARIATTETFTAYNTQWRANLEGEEGTWRWDALLDKRTCSRCGGLQGKSWDRLADVPSIPVHANCRCVLIFQPK